MDKTPLYMYYYFMQYKAFHERVRKSGLSMKGFAAFVGIGRKTISNYSKIGEVPNHLALIALLLAELAKYEVEPRVIGDKFDALGRRPRKRSRGGFKGRAKLIIPDNMVNVGGQQPPPT